MSDRIQTLIRSFQVTAKRMFRGVGTQAGKVTASLPGRTTVITLGLLAAGGYAVYAHPPMQSIGRGEVGMRLNQFTGSSTEVRDGAVLIIPVLHTLRRFSLRDQVYRPTASGMAPFQSVEGLSIGVDISVRYALDANKIAVMARDLPDDISGEIVEPMVQGVLYKTLARYSVRDIFSGKRTEIQQVIETELKPRLAADGIKLVGVTMGKVDLPPDYKAGMERLLAEELASEKMRYTLELKEKQVKQTELEATAEKVRRETEAQAAGEEQIIAAKAQAEAMRHVLPFKQKQIEQRALEAEAEKVSRIKTAEGTARQIGSYLKSSMMLSPITKIGALLAKSGFDVLKKKMDPRRVNGGPFLGLNGIAIKSHGGTDAIGFASAVELGYQMAESGFVAQLAADIGAIAGRLEAPPQPGVPGQPQAGGQ